MKINDIITEAREADLYHGTTIFAAERILETNRFQARSNVEQWTRKLLKNPNEENQTVSFSRDFITAQSFMDSSGDNRFPGVIFVIDQNLLYRDLGQRIVPYNDLVGMETQQIRRLTKRTEFEEAVFGDIENADRYIKEIIVFVSPGWYNRLDELEIGDRYPIIASNPKTRYMPRLLRPGADEGRPSYALGRRGQFYSRRELQHRADQKLSKQPEELSEVETLGRSVRYPFFSIFAIVEQRTGRPGLKIRFRRDRPAETRQSGIYVWHHPDWGYFYVGIAAADNFTERWYKHVQKLLDQCTTATQMRNWKAFADKFAQQGYGINDLKDITLRFFPRPHPGTSTFKKELENIETRIVRMINPMCNYEYDPDRPSSTRIPPAKVPQ
jgi:hypothetical protein